MDLSQDNHAFNVLKTSWSETQISIFLLIFQICVKFLTQELNYVHHYVHHLNSRSWNGQNDPQKRIESNKKSIITSTFYQLPRMAKFTRRSLPVHNSSILLNCERRQSLTHDNMSCLDRLSVVTLVE